MGGERLLRTLVLAVIGLAVFAVFRPTSPDPTEDVRSRETWFFIAKTHQEAAYDGVVVGDSRALRGVAPGVLEESLPGRTVFNFSFNACGMNDEMYDEAEALLDPAAADPFIVLAPTSLSFMPIKTANSQFHEYRSKPRDQVWLYRRAPQVAEWLQPVSPSVYLRRLLDIRPHRRLIQEFHADGWIETDQFPHDDLSDLSIHRERLVGHRADPGLVQAFMDRTGEWTARGIRVFAFFPPAHPPRMVQEDSMLAFDRDEFVERFTAAGGTWLDAAPRDLVTYDGSHLVAASARELSRGLGLALQANGGDGTPAGVID